MQFISKALEAIYKLLINMRYIPIIVYVKVIKIEPEINPFLPKVLDQNIHFLNTGLHFLNILDYLHRNQSKPFYSR